MPRPTTTASDNTSVATIARRPSDSVGESQRSALDLPASPPLRDGGRAPCVHVHRRPDSLVPHDCPNTYARLRCDERRRSARPHRVFRLLSPKSADVCRRFRGRRAISDTFAVTESGSPHRFVRTTSDSESAVVRAPIVHAADRERRKTKASIGPTSPNDTRRVHDEIGISRFTRTDIHRPLL